MVVWIMLAYSCWHPHTRIHIHKMYICIVIHTYIYIYRRLPLCVSLPQTYPFSARARPTAEGSNFGRVRWRIRCRCFRNQATRTRSSRITTPSIHQFIIHLMTVRERALSCTLFLPMFTSTFLSRSGNFFSNSANVKI